MRSQKSAQPVRPPQCLTELRKTPALLKCDPKSLFGAVVQASQLGLEPGNALGHAYLIPFKKEVTLIIGYRGMIDLARRSGQVHSIVARAVHANDDFSYSFGIDDHLEHKPADRNRGDLTHVYAIAKLQGGGVQFEVMTREEVLAIKKQSKAGNNGPWVSHFDEMAKKTVIRRLFKMLPVSIEMKQAVNLEEQSDRGESQGNSLILDGDFEEIQDEAPARRARRTRKEMNASEDEVGQTGTGEITLAMVTGELDKATNQDELDLAIDMANTLSEQDKAIAANHYEARVEQMTAGQDS